MSLTVRENIIDGNVIELRDGTRVLSIANRLLTWENIISGGGYADLDHDYDVHGRACTKNIEDIVVVYSINDIYFVSLEDILTTKTTVGLIMKGWYNRSLVVPSLINWDKVPKGTPVLAGYYLTDLKAIHNCTDQYVYEGEFLGNFPSSPGHDEIAIRNSSGKIVGYKFATIHPLVEFDISWLKKEKEE